MKKVKLLIIIFLTMNMNAENSNVKEIHFHEFLNYIEENKLSQSQMEVTFEGEFMRSPISEKEFLYYEAIAFNGQDNPKDSYSILYEFDKNFYLIYKNLKVKISQRQIRTFLDPAYSETITREYKNKSSVQYQILESFKDCSKIIIEEYGLQSDKKYFMMTHTDEYNIESEGKVRIRKNIVLHISDKVFKNSKAQSELTPVYQGWTY